MSAADEAKKISEAHKKWMIECFRENGGECSYEKIVELHLEHSTLFEVPVGWGTTLERLPPNIHVLHVGEEKSCDTVGAMLKLLKRDKVVTFEGQFLMYPMHKDVMIQIIAGDATDAYYAALG